MLVRLENELRQGLEEKESDKKTGASEHNVPQTHCRADIERVECFLVLPFLFHDFLLFLFFQITCFVVFSSLSFFVIFMMVIL